LGAPFQTELNQLALTRRLSTMNKYRHAALRFLAFLGKSFPRLQRLPELRRDPHLHHYLQHLCQLPWCKKTRYNHLVCLRRMLDDLAVTATDPPPPFLLLWSDIPHLDIYLPRPISVEDDRLLSAHLSASTDIASAALRLLRSTGMRIGECLDLTTHSLLHPSANCRAIHVPLGKLHTERSVPITEDTRATFLRMLDLRQQFPSAATSCYLLPRPFSRDHWYCKLAEALRAAARQAGCSTEHITPHQLRHTFATEMIRAGLSLPALMQMLGHHDIRMTLRYVEVTQTDLQREFHLARQRLASVHQIPSLPALATLSPGQPTLLAVRDALQASRRLLESRRRDSAHSNPQRKTLGRLSNRIAKVSRELDRLLATQPPA